MESRISLSKLLLTIGALGMVAYHAVASQYLFFGQWEHQPIHFAFLLFLIFVSYARKAKSRRSRASCTCAWPWPWPVAPTCT